MIGRVLIIAVVTAGIQAITPATASAQCCPDRCCCRPHVTKIIYKHPLLVGAVPPQGAAVASVPAVMVATPALAIHPAAFAPTGASLSQADIDRLAEAVRRSPASAAPSPAATRECNDPCGDIKQLRKDVDDLIAVTKRLTAVIEPLAVEYKKAHP